MFLTRTPLVVSPLQFTTWTKGSAPRMLTAEHYADKQMVRVIFTATVSNRFSPVGIKDLHCPMRRQDATQSGCFVHQKRPAAPACRVHR